MRTSRPQRLLPLDGITIAAAVDAILAEAPVHQFTGRAGSVLSAPDEDITERLRLEAEMRERRFSVDVKNTTAREVLNAICASHGDRSWEVIYTGEPLDSAHSRVGLSGPLHNR